MDWPGLLKWSVSHSDGTKPTKDIKMMTDNDKKWLQEAMAEYTFDEIGEMERLLKIMTELDPENSDNYVEIMLENLDGLQDLTFSLDMSKNQCILGGLTWLYDLIFTNKHKEIRSKAALILSECCQNEPYIQNSLLKQEPLRQMNRVLQEESIKNKESSFTALSSLIRGLNIDQKRKFIDCDGVEFLLTLLYDTNSEYSVKLKAKAISIIQDLITYEKHLLEDIDVLGKESYKNTTGKIVNGNSNDIEVIQETNATPEQAKPKMDYSKYKDIVKIKLLAGNYMSLFKDMLEGVDNRAINLREAYLDVLKIVVLHSQVKKWNVDYANGKAYLQERQTMLQEFNNQNENCNEGEIEKIKNVLVYIK